MVQHPTPSSLAIAVVLVKLALVAPIALGTVAAGAADRAVTVTGCLRAGSEKGTFILATASGNVAVFSTTIGLTEHVGHHLTVSGRPKTTKRYGRLLNVRTLKIVESACPRP